jgi:uncharacterized protein YndB with AHSA1/START domain
MKGFTVKQSIKLQASPSEVWRALTDPEEIKKYFYGTNAVSDWKVGSSIVFKGEWEGQPYEDKGTILELIPGEKLVYNYWSSFSGQEDIPENYANITYQLTPQQDGTLLEITQDGIESEEKRAHSESSWRSVLESLKEILYSKSMA